MHLPRCLKLPSQGIVCDVVFGAFTRQSRGVVVISSTAFFFSFLLKQSDQETLAFSTSITCLPDFSIDERQVELELSTPVGNVHVEAVIEENFDNGNYDRSQQAAPVPDDMVNSYLL